MSKYTAEQVERLAYVIDGNSEKLDGGEYYDEVSDAAQKLRDYAALLRQHEAAKGRVTDEVVNVASRAFYAHPERIIHSSIFTSARMRAALEAAAPMLLNARVPDALEIPLLIDYTNELLMAQVHFSEGWNAYRSIILAAAPGYCGLV